MKQVSVPVHRNIFAKRARDTLDEWPAVLVGCPNKKGTTPRQFVRPSQAPTYVPAKTALIPAIPIIDPIKYYKPIAVRKAGPLDWF